MTDNKTNTVQINHRMNHFVGLMQIAQKLRKSNPKYVLTTTKTMAISEDDVQQLLRSLNSHNVAYLMVGGMAGIVHGHYRTTQDLDLWIKANDTNKQNLIAALIENNVTGATYLENTPLIFGWTSVRFGRFGFELDMGYSLKNFSETDFDTCYERALLAEYDDVTFRVIHLNDLIAEKIAVGRLKDQYDVEELIKLKNNAV
jgi:hypothetical protein